LPPSSHLLPEVFGFCGRNQKKRKERRQVCASLDPGRSLCRCRKVDNDSERPSPPGNAAAAAA
jgi:hypothetical protein